MFLYRLFSDQSLLDVNTDFFKYCILKAGRKCSYNSSNSAGVQQLPEFFISTKCYKKKRPNL